MSEPRADRLLNQLRWVTSLSASLGAVESVDQVMPILLSGLLSPDGLGYSAVVLLELDPLDRHFEGRYALAFESREDIQRLGAMLASEEHELERRNSDPAVPLDGDSREAFANYRLKHSTQWVTIIQVLDLDGEPNKSFQGSRFPIRRHIRGGARPDFFSEAIQTRAPKAHTKSELGDRLPAAIAALLHEHFAAVPIAYSNSVRSLLLVDRRWDEHPEVTHTDLEELDYFANQCALALANLSLISDLNQALKDLKSIETLKSNFLSTVSHELRTPLTAIMGFVDLLRSQTIGPLNNGQATLIERVARNTAHLHRVLTDVIDIAELQIEQSAYRTLTLVDPLLILTSALTKLDNRRRDIRCEVVPVIPEDGIPRVLSDPSALARILFHLLDNAMKFNRNGSPIRVIFTHDASNLSIAIQDQGIGIPADKLGRIFEHFFQVDNSMTRSQEGLGVGLTIVRMLLHGVRGTIHVESEHGSGSTFTVTLPLPPKDATDAPQSGEYFPMSTPTPLDYLED